MVDSRILTPLSIGPIQNLQENAADISADMRSLCGDVINQNENFKATLQRSEEANAFLKGHSEQLKYEIAHLKGQMASRVQSVMSLQFKLLRQDLLHCAQQARFRKSEQELQALLKERDTAVEQLKAEISMLQDEKSALAAEVERLNFALTGIQFIANRHEERTATLEARNRELEDEVERLKFAESALRAEKQVASQVEEQFVRALADKEDENRRLGEKLELLEEYVTASKEADDLVSDTFTNVLATLDAWKRGDEEDESDTQPGNSSGAVHSGNVPEVTVSDAEDMIVSPVELEGKEDVHSWSHNALLAAWTSPPASDSPCCPSSRSCLVPLPPSPAAHESPSTPMTAMPDIDEEQLAFEVSTGSSGSFESDVPGSPTVVGSECETDTESELESIADDEQDAPVKRHSCQLDSPMLLFRKYAHGIPDDEFSPLVEERFSPIDVHSEGSDDDICNRVSASQMKHRSPSLSSIGTCNGLATFKADRNDSKVIPGGLARRRFDKRSNRDSRRWRTDY